MPLPNEHSARLRDPDDFDPDTFRRTKGGTIYGSKKVPETVGIIWGKLKGAADPADNPIPQALRFPTEHWTAAEAKKWLADNEIDYKSFEAASESDSAEPVREVRSISGLELRESEGKRPLIAGYAAVYDCDSTGLPWIERIAVGAFKDILASGPDVRALLNHDANLLLGRTKAKTLTLTEDERGLRCEITPPDNQVGRDAVESIRRGDLDGMSFSFLADDAWGTREGKEIRTLTRIRQLFDVGPVVFPAYQDTSVAVRSLERWQAEQQAQKPAQWPDPDWLRRDMELKFRK